MLMIPQEEVQARQDGTDRIEGGAFDGVMDKQTPFMYKVYLTWICYTDSNLTDLIFIN